MITMMLGLAAASNLDERNNAAKAAHTETSRVFMGKPDDA